MSNFTQGKWKVVQGAGVDEFDVISKDAPLHNCICVLFGYPTSRRDEQKANARLIAAAPEMYQWIEDARDFLSEWKLRCGDEDEMRAYWPEFCRTFHELLTTSDLLMMRIDGKEAQS